MASGLEQASDLSNDCKSLYVGNLGLYKISIFY